MLYCIQDKEIGYGYSVRTQIWPARSGSTPILSPPCLCGRPSLPREGSAMTFREYLEYDGACEAACQWVGNRGMKWAWDNCTYPAWMMYLLSVNCALRPRLPSWPSRLEYYDLQNAVDKRFPSLRYEEWFTYATRFRTGEPVTISATMSSWANYPSGHRNLRTNPMNSQAAETRYSDCSAHPPDVPPDRWPLLLTGVCSPVRRSTSLPPSLKGA